MHVVDTDSSERHSLEVFCAGMTMRRMQLASKLYLLVLQQMFGCQQLSLGAIFGWLAFC